MSPKRLETVAELVKEGVDSDVEPARDIEIDLYPEEEESEPILRRFLKVINPPVDKLTKGKEDALYAADIFLPEKLAKVCRTVAFVVAALLTAIPLLFLTDRPYNPFRVYPPPAFFSNKYYQTLFSASSIQSIALNVGLAVLAFLLLYPWLVKAFFNAVVSLKLTEKREKIDRNMYTLLCMLSGLGKGGVPLGKAVDLIAKSNIDGIREEFAKIHTSVTILGYDLKTAVLRVALTTPSERLSHFLKGFVNFLERSKDYAEYMEEYLQLDNVNRRIELAAYGEKLKQISAIYVTLVTLFSALIIITLTYSFMESIHSIYNTLIVYVILPIVCAGMTVFYYIGSPDKGAERAKKREAMYLTAIVLSLGILSAYLPMLKLKMALLGAGVAVSLAAHINVRKAMKADEEIERELNTLLMSLYAASRAGESMLDTLKATSGELANRLKKVVAASATKPIGDALREASLEAKHPFLSAVLYILGNVVHSTRKLSDVLTALIYEYHRYTEYSKLRGSIMKTTAALVAVALVLTAFCMGVMKLEVIPTMVTAAEKTKGQFKFDEVLATRIANDAVIMLAAMTPFTLSSISWDFRKSFKYFIGTYTLALLFIYFT